MTMILAEAAAKLFDGVKQDIASKAVDDLLWRLAPVAVVVIVLVVGKELKERWSKS